jgi:hypothetical protein
MQTIEDRFLLDLQRKEAQNSLVEPKKNYSWLKRLLVPLVTMLAGGITIGFISLQLQVGPITIIIGDRNKVENGSQTQAVIQPAKPTTVEAESATTTSPVVDTSPAQSTQQVSSTTTTSSQPPVRRRAARAQNDFEEEDCTCPDEAEEEEESEPPPQQFYQQAQQFQHPRTYYSNAVSTVQSQSQNNGVSVQSNSRSISVSNSVVNGQSHTRIVVNGKVIVDQ